MHYTYQTNQSHLTSFITSAHVQFFFVQITVIGVVLLMTTQFANEKYRRCVEAGENDEQECAAKAGQLDAEQLALLSIIVAPIEALLVTFGNCGPMHWRCCPQPCCSKCADRLGRFVIYLYEAHLLPTILLFALN